jgi:hypothetical protein
MIFLPTGPRVVYPDGIVRNCPKDGDKFVHNGETYTWDIWLGEWVDWKGDIIRFKETEGTPSMYGNWINPEYQQLPLANLEGENANKKSEKEKLKDFFFPKNTEGCECGAWITGSDKHSSYCKLYKKEGK